MTILIEGENSIYLASTATILQDDREVASSWAAAHVVDNPNYKWILAKFVEADNANSNAQYWSYNDLRINQFTIANSPMNMNHNSKAIVGTWVASEMMIPTEQSQAMNPYIETVGAFWKFYNPTLLDRIEQDYASGQLWTSMECISDSITCGGDNGCGETFDYAGPMSDTYCQHIQDRSSYRQLNNPKFLGGALITSDNRPGWKNADVKDISRLTSDDDKNKIIAEIAKAQPGLSPKEWEDAMWAIQMQALNK